MKYLFKYQKDNGEIAFIEEVQFALFGLSENLPLPIGPSSLKHSYGYASADDSPICLGSFPLNFESFMQYPGLVHEHLSALRTLYGRKKAA